VRRLASPSGRLARSFTVSSSRPAGPSSAGLAAGVAGVGAG
jgi:hypothetical protein